VAYPAGDIYRYRDGHAQRVAHRHAHGDRDANCERLGYRHGHPDSDMDPNGNVYANLDFHLDGDSDTDHDASPCASGRTANATGDSSH
jgi:hypothetical protein